MSEATLRVISGLLIAFVHLASAAHAQTRPPTDAEIRAAVEQLRTAPGSLEVQATPNGNGLFGPKTQDLDRIHAELERIGPVALPELLRALHRDSSDRMRENVAFFLSVEGLYGMRPSGQRGWDFRPALPQIIEAMNDPDDYVKNRAIEIIRYLGVEGNAALQQLLGFVKTGGASRGEACATVVAVGGRGADVLAALTEAAKDPNSYTQIACNRAADRLRTGFPLPHPCFWPVVPSCSQPARLSNWSASVVFKERHELIEGGPYRFVRHPISSGVLLMLFGTMLVWGRLVGVVAFVGIVVGLSVKASLEERLLMRHFPEAYALYRRRVRAAVIPFVV